MATRERILRLILASDMPVAYTDAAGIIRHVSDGYRDAFGDYVGCTIDDATHPDDRHVLALHRQVLDGGPIRAGTFVKRYIRRVDGTAVPAMVQVRAREKQPGSVEIAWPEEWSLAVQQEQVARQHLRRPNLDVIYTDADAELLDLYAEVYPVGSGSRTMIAELAIMAAVAFRACVALTIGRAAIIIATAYTVF